MPHTPILLEGKSSGDCKKQFLYIFFKLFHFFISIYECFFIMGMFDPENFQKNL